MNFNTIQLMRYTIFFLFGLAACSDTDETTTQSVPEPATEAPLEPADEGAVIVDEA